MQHVSPIVIKAAATQVMAVGYFFSSTAVLVTAWIPG